MEFFANDNNAVHCCLTRREPKTFAWNAKKFGFNKNFDTDKIKKKLPSSARAKKFRFK